MSMRRRIVTALVRIYPETWRREYGPELADLLLTGSLRPRVIVNVLCSGILQRIRGSEMRSLWARALVALLSMDALLALMFAARFSYGNSDGEFGGPFGTAVFAAIIGTPYCLGALMGMIVPVTAVLKARRCSLTLPKAILTGIALSLPAFAVVVFGGWLFDGADLSLLAFVKNVLRFPLSNAILLATFALGGAIVVSGQSRDCATSHPRQVTLA